MGISRKKIILTIILAILSVILFGFIIMMQNHATLVKKQSGDETLEKEEVSYTLEEIQSNWNNMDKRLKDRYEVDATLSALALRNIIAEEGDQAISRYSNGAVIKVEKGRIKAPGNIDQKLGLTADLFKEKSGLFPSPENSRTLVAYSLIRDSYYYVEWYKNTNLQKEVEEAVDIPGILQRAETAYDVYALCVSEDSLAKGGKRILYCNSIFTDLEEIFANEDAPEISVEKTDQDNVYESGTVTLQNGTFHYAKSTVPEINGYLILLSIQPNLYVKALSQAIYMFTALILFIAALLTSGFSLYYFIQKNTLTPVMEERYRPANVRRFASLCGIIGTVLIFLSGMIIYALNGLYDNTSKGKERLRMLEESLVMYGDRVKMNMEHFADIYLDYGTNIAECLDNYPELREKSVLDTLADRISASSITLYDKEGNETVSSGDYIGLSLGTDPESTTYDFRRILNGVPSVVHGEETDETTGKSEVRVGLRIRDSLDPERYGVMIISVEPTLWRYTLSEMTNSVLKNLSGKDTIFFIAGLENGRILSSSKESLVGQDISAFGLNETHLRAGLVKNVETDEGSWFITSDMLVPDNSGTADSFRAADNSGMAASLRNSEDMIVYYAGARNSDLKGMLASSVTGGLLFFLIYVILAWFVLGGYTDEYFEKFKNKNQPEEEQESWGGIWQYIAAIRPEKTGLITMEFIIGLYLIQWVPVANFKTTISRNSVYYYLASGNWEKGLNLFALAGTLYLLGQIIFVVILIRLLLALCATFSGPKGKTIFRLIRSITMYVALFVFLIMACTYFGISMSVILTAIGTLGIAVSLGAQDFVSDIIAGLTIVFEGTFHVGDIVDVGIGGKEYHGEVMEIGLRFIKLQTLSGGIVTISNRDITMANNMTQLNYRYTCEFAVSSEYPIEEIEKMLERELPKIGKSDWRILAGPVYNGIVALGGGTMTLSVTTECSEEDLAEVKKFVNGSLERIFLKNGFRI